jgi:FtsZ-binding cell division protein ZapB
MKMLGMVVSIAALETIAMKLQEEISELKNQNSMLECKNDELTKLAIVLEQERQSHHSCFTFSSTNHISLSF